MQKSLGGHIVIPSQSPSVIPIVDPTSDGEPAEQKTTKVVLKPPLKGSINGKRLCRNVIIHGYCKYEGKGCEFNHDSNKPTLPQTSPENKNKLRVQPSLQAVSSVPADSVNAPEFVPRFTIDPKESIDFNALDPSIAKQQTSYQLEKSTNNVSTLTNGFTDFNISSDSTPQQSHQQPQQQPQPQQPQQPQSQTQQSQSPSQMLAGLGMVPANQMDPFYYMNQQSMYPRQPLQHHLYSSNLPHVSNLLPHQRTAQSFFIPDDIREQLTERNEAQLMTSTARDLGLPMEVHVYHSLYPLDAPSEKKSSSFYGHPSSVYRATCTMDGRSYALVRIEGYRLVNELAMTVVEAWRRIRHCNIVSIREAFTTRAFGDSSLIFAYDYHPCSTTLYSTYFTPQGQAALYNNNNNNNNNNNGNNNRLVPETTLWSYITQIASALKAIHGSGLAARNIDPKKILITSKNRLRLSGSAILDVLQFGGVLNVPRQQQEDLLSFGKLMIALACNSLQSFTDLAQSFEHIARFYSPDFKNLILYLLSKPQPNKNIDEVVVMIGPRILHEINCSQYHNDELESQLARELENGRLARLMVKMGFINERPEFDMDPGWSETGDRYLIKLFRDYVFHQVDENGRPVVDMVHVLTCLNKLDAGIEEKIMLMSRDEQSCLIVSFKEIKNCINSAFTDLTSGRK